jgi:hypothetical protein
MPLILDETLKPKNIIINGSLLVAQRGTSFANGGSGGVLVRGLDRWNFWIGGTMASTLSRQPAVNGQGYAMRFQRNAGTATSTNVQITQHIDLEQVKALAGKTVTLSFYVRKGANFSSTNFAAQIVTGTAATEVNLITTGFTGAVTAALALNSITTTSTRVYLTTTIPANALQMAVNFYADTFTGTAGANDWYEVEQVMLTEGGSLAPFRTAGESIQQELSLCQRYYEIGTFFHSYDGFNNGTTRFGSFCAWKVTKRVTPSCIATDAGSSGLSSFEGFGVTQTPQVNGAAITAIAASHGGSAGTQIACTWTADAEL